MMKAKDSLLLNPFKRVSKSSAMCSMQRFALTMLTLASFCVFLFCLSAAPPRVLASSSCPLVKEITAFFPVLEGYVVEVKGENIFLDLAKDSEVRKGMEFLCIREGEEFTHPITGAVLGRFEDKLGYVQITEIMESYSIGKLVRNFSGKVVKRGDKVRITSARIPVAFPPESPQDPILEAMKEELRKSGRFSIVSREGIMAALAEAGYPDLQGLTTRQIMDLSEKLDISAIIYPSEQTSGTESIVTARIVSGRTGTVMGQVSGPCTVTQGATPSFSPEDVEVTSPEAPGAVDRFSGPLHGGIASLARLSQELPVSIRHMAVGDVTGDGREEICVSDGRDISLYTWQDDGTLQPVFVQKGGSSEDHLSLDIADINGNGRAEIFASSLEMDSLQSFVLEWNEGKLTRIWERVPLFLRIISVYPGDNVLAGQAMGMAEPFDPRVTRLSWAGNRYETAEDIDLPSSVSILSVGKADLDGDGIEEVVALDKYLRVYRNGKRVWKSEEEYGQRTLFFAHTPKGALITTDEENRIYLPSHLRIQDMNGNGRPDILLIKNISSTGGLFPQSQLFRKGEACLIEWNGISFSETWCSGPIDAYLTDVGIGDINADKSEDLILSMVLVSGIGKFWRSDPSKILIY
ncbi:MAG: FG-GAP-like repeat-containing protein [bacterium]